MEKNNIVYAYNWKIHKFDDSNCYLIANVLNHRKVEDRHCLESSMIKDIILHDDYALIKTYNSIFKCKYIDCSDMHESLPKRLAELKWRSLKAIEERITKELDLIESLDLKEKDVCIFFSTYRNYYFDKAYTCFENGIREYDFSVNPGMFQDSVMIFPIPYIHELEFSYYPYKVAVPGGRLEFYDYRAKENNVYIYNSGYEDVEIDVPFEKFLIKPKTIEIICIENKGAMIDESITAAIDMYLAYDDTVIIDDLS